MLVSEQAPGTAHARLDLINNEQELEEFRRRYGIEGEIPKFY